MDLQLDSARTGQFLVLTVAGEIDMDSAPQLREQVIEQLTGDADQLVIDMAGVTFMDSSGLSVLVAALKRVRDSGGDLRLVVTRERTMKLFRITSLDTVFNIHASLQDAMDGIPMSAEASLPA